MIPRGKDLTVSSPKHPTPVVLQALAALEMDLTVMMEVRTTNATYYYEILPAGWIRRYKQDGIDRTMERVRNALTLMA